MTVFNVFKALGPIDVRNVRRDSMLRWMAAMPFIFAVMFRFVVPWLQTVLLRQFAFDLTPYYWMFMGYGFILGIPIIFGVVIGFLLLDERDEGTLTALQITPLTLRSYLGYRITIPMLLSILLTVLTFPLAGLSALPVLHLFWVAVAAAPLAPIFALLLAALAANKVQGFAIMKGLGVFLILPLIAYFVPAGWQLLFGLAPTYWPTKLFWMLKDGIPGAWIYFAAGLGYQALLLALLMRRFDKAMHR